MSDKTELNNQETFFEFPCVFPIKIMMISKQEYLKEVINILEKNIKNSNEIDFKVRESKNKKYISLTAKFIAESKNQLDILYKEISSLPYVHMVL